MCDARSGSCATGRCSPSPRARRSVPCRCRIRSPGRSPSRSPGSRPKAVTLPWDDPDGEFRTFQLFFTDAKSKAYNRSVFSQGDWKRALATAGVIPPRGRGAKYMAAAPEDGMHALRHTYASVLLDAGESIKALSEYLGHSDPGFTLRTCTHLMP